MRCELRMNDWKPERNPSYGIAVFIIDPEDPDTYLVFVHQHTEVPSLARGETRKEMEKVVAAGGSIWTKQLLEALGLWDDAKEPSTRFAVITPSGSELPHFDFFGRAEPGMEEFLASIDWPPEPDATEWKWG